MLLLQNKSPGIFTYAVLVQEHHGVMNRQIKWWFYMIGPGLKRANMVVLSHSDASNHLELFFPLGSLLVNTQVHVGAEV